MKLPIISSSFVKIQRTYVTPSIEEMLTNHQNVFFEEFRGKGIVVLVSIVLNAFINMFRMSLILYNDQPLHVSKKIIV